MTAPARSPRRLAAACRRAVGVARPDGRRRTVAALAAATVLAGIWSGVDAVPQPAAAAPPHAGEAVPVPRDVPRAPSPRAAQPSVPLDAPVRVRIPAVGVDLEVRALSAVDGRLDPPTATRAYWVAAYGRPGPPGADPAGNTVYLAGHSSAAGDAAFDPLLTGPDGGSALQAGDRVQVDTSAGTLTYRVQGSARYPKDALASVAAVWQAVPDRLVLITCVQRDGARSRHNLVVTAHAESWAPASR